MKSLKPVLGIKHVKITDIEKKGEPSRWTITVRMETTNSGRKVVDNLFYDEERPERASYLNAVFAAWCEQGELDITKYRTETDEEDYEWDEDKLISDMIGKEIMIERYTTQSQRNNEIYYNVRYNPTVNEEAPDLD